MTRVLRVLALLLSLALAAAACGGGEADLAEDATTTTTTTAADDEAEAESTTTSADEAEAEEEAMEDEESSNEDIEPSSPSGPSFPLTGEILGAGDDPSHAAVVVKISNNDGTARQALDGLDEADIIFEERIEQEATRFLAVFHSSFPEQVGSIRSGRTSDINIVANLNRPVFGFSGANDGVHAQLRTADGDGILIRVSADFGDPEFTRIGSFSAPDNMVADVSRLLERAPEDSEPPQSLYDYSNNVTELGQRSPGVIAAARSDAQYVWSEVDSGYLRFQGENPLVTRDDVQITPKNVIIMTTTYLPSQVDASSVDAVTIGQGPVEVYSNGFRVEGTWTREFARDPYTLETADGETIGLAPGQTWVSLAPANTATELRPIEAQALRPTPG